MKKNRNRRSQAGNAYASRHSDQIQRRLPPVPFAAAVVADAGDDQAVAGDAEVVFAADGVAEVCSSSLLNSISLSQIWQ